MIQEDSTTTLQDRTDTLQNQPDSSTLIAQAGGVGSWQLLSYSSPILPCHAALLRTGKVFFFAGSGNDPDNAEETKGSALLDLSDGTFSRPVTPLNIAGFPVDIFCAGQTFLADGRLLVAGGTLFYDPFAGALDALAFDPSTEKWTTLPSMTQGRWYPTLLTLGDGKVLAVSGLDENGNLSRNPEFLYDTTNGWTNCSQKTTSNLPMYAHLFLLDNGKIFYSGGDFDGYGGVSPRILSLPTVPASFTKPITTAITEKAVTGLQDASYSNQAASVLLPPAQDQKVMVIGGGNGGGTATKRVNIVDLKATTPTYKAAASLNYSRMHCSAVILPDHTVFVCGGSGSNESKSNARKAGEIYDPSTDTWTVTASATVERLYHSVALLLPDGRVLTAGGNPVRKNNELRLEIYSPPYISQTRPTITSAPSSVTYGEKITISTPQASNIRWASLVRPSATTHSCDTEQRLVDFTINSASGSSLTVTLTSNKNLAPPGYYMLFVTDQNKVPSVAKWIQVA
jgi:hypothetical protein